MFNWKGVIGYTLATMIAAFVFGLFVEAHQQGIAFLLLIGLVVGVFFGGTISVYCPRYPVLGSFGLSIASALVVVVLFVSSYGAYMLLPAMTIFFTLFVVGGLVAGVSYRIASSIGSGTTTGTNG